MFRRRSNTAPHRVLARADAGTEAADAFDRCSRQQDGAHRLGLTGDGCDLSSSGRSGLKPPAIRRRRRRRRVKRRVWRTLNERRIGKPVFHTAPRARGCDLDPVCELPYRPAATERPQQRPNRCQHLTTRTTVPKILLALTEASTDVKRRSPTIMSNLLSFHGLRHGDISDILS